MNRDAPSTKRRTGTEDDTQTRCDDAQSLTEIGDAALARLCEESADEDYALAAEGLAEYARSLLAEDSAT